MSKRNQYDGRCSVCNTEVRALEGVIEEGEGAKRYVILCPEHAPTGTLESPRPPESSKLPSIHTDERHYER